MMRDCSALRGWRCAKNISHEKAQKAQRIILAGTSFLDCSLLCLLCLFVAYAFIDSCPR